MRKIRDILHVMKMLGHRNIKSTLICTQLVEFRDEHTAKVAHTGTEAPQLEEAGFEFVCDFNEAKNLQEAKI
jgi:hypothetical protein